MSVMTQASCHGLRAAQIAGRVIGVDSQPVRRASEFVAALIAGPMASSTLVRTIDTVACETPAASAISRCVGRVDERGLVLVLRSFIADNGFRVDS